jgi:hypothetical protein
MRRQRSVFKQTACNKIRHDTYAAAKSHLGEVTALNMSKGTPHKDKGLQVYRCPDCGKYHVGHEQFAAKRGNGAHKRS